MRYAPYPLKNCSQNHILSMHAAHSTAEKIHEDLQIAKWSQVAGDTCDTHAHTRSRLTNILVLFYSFAFYTLAEVDLLLVGAMDVYRTHVQ